MLSINTKFYLKVFVFTGLTFGTLMAILDLLSGDGFSIWEFIFSSLFFGVFMSFFIVRKVLKRLKRLGIDELNEDIIKVKQKIRIDSNISQQELVKRIKEAYRFKNSKVLEEENKIIIKTKISWESWGEKIEIIFPIENADSKEIILISKPSFGLTIIDYGKNYENVKYIEELIL